MTHIPYIFHSIFKCAPWREWLKLWMASWILQRVLSHILHLWYAAWISYGRDREERKTARASPTSFHLGSQLLHCQSPTQLSLPLPLITLASQHRHYWEFCFALTACGGKLNFEKLSNNPISPGIQPGSSHLRRCTVITTRLWGFQDRKYGWGNGLLLVT